MGPLYKSKKSLHFIRSHSRSNWSTMYLSKLTTSLFRIFWTTFFNRWGTFAKIQNLRFGSHGWGMELLTVFALRVAISNFLLYRLSFPYIQRCLPFIPNNRHRDPFGPPMSEASPLHLNPIFHAFLTIVPTKWLGHCYPRERCVLVLRLFTYSKY